ncbi:MAG TPA: hypothetical protein VFQ68_11895 [Streptosporangiaceae bacterium]|nr:hypothetical protein [Streptosporangiaceae bacterium]
MKRTSRNANAAAPLPLRLTADALQQARQAGRAAWASPPWTRLKWRWQRTRRGWSDRDLWSLDALSVRSDRRQPH